MIKFRPLIFLSVAVAVLLGCNTDSDSELNEVKWQTSFFAMKLGGEIDYFDYLEDNESTRSLFIGGQSGNRFAKLWDNNDVAHVYKDGVQVGTLSPNSTGNEYTTLTGTLTGSFAVDDEITLYMPSPDLNYIGQDGTIGNMSRYFDFMSTTVKVASVDGSSITTEEIIFGSLQAYFMFKFKDEDNKLLHVKQLVIEAASGKLVATKSMNGTTTYTDKLIVNMAKDHSSVDDYPTEVYWAMLNESGEKDTYTFTVTATDGKVYKSISPLNYKMTIGRFASARRAQYCATVDMDIDTSIMPPDSDNPDVGNLTL